MSKLSKLLVMALVILAVVTMSVRVNAGTQELKNYISTYHVFNGMMYELTNQQKTQVLEYLANVPDGQANAALAKIQEAEGLVQSTGAQSFDKMSADVKQKAISLASEAANAVGLTLKVDTGANTFALYNGSKVVTSGNANSLVTNPNRGGAPAAGGAAPAAPAGNTLLYTGANYVSVAVVALAIVAIAVVVKKRA